MRLGGGLAVGVEQRAQHADVLDRERAVGRRVQVADVVQAVLVLPRGELVDQPAERVEQGASWWYETDPRRTRKSAGGPFRAMVRTLSEAFW